MNTSQSVNQIERVCTYILRGLLSIVLLYLSILAWFFTQQFPRDYTRMLTGNSTITIISLVVCCGLIATWLFTDKKAIEKLNTKKLSTFVLVLTAILGLLWISTATVRPSSDAMQLLTIAKSFDKKTAPSASLTNYLHLYPFQSGFLLYQWVIGKLFGFSNYFAMRLFNIAWILIADIFLWKETNLVFHSKKTTNTTVILTAAFLPWILFSSYLYGVVPSLALCLIACYLQIKSTNETTLRKRIIYGLLSCCAIGFALVLKPNSLIFLIALELMWLLMIITRRQLLALIFVVANVVVYLLSGSIPTAIVNRRMNLDLGDGAPKSAWISMGLQRNDSSYARKMSAPGPAGWYNGSIGKLAAEKHYDIDEMSNELKPRLKAQLIDFVKNPNEAVSFFNEKTVNQWTEPTFASLYMTFKSGVVNTQNSGKDSLIQRSIYKGKLQTIYLLWCDIFMTLIFTFALISFLRMKREMNLQALLFGIIFLGGFAYSIISEAHPRYTLVYFFLLIPYAAHTISSNSKFALGSKAHLLSEISDQSNVSSSLSQMPNLS